MADTDLTDGTGTAPAAPTSPTSPRSPLPADSSHTTRHTIDLGGTEWTYDATVSSQQIEGGTGKPAASVFSASFTALPDGSSTDSSRPITFIFNGGPGSSSTFLLLGSIGPKRIVTSDTASAPGAPYGLADNPLTLLATSDLVFIDAPGAGFSTIAEDAKPKLWSVDGDVAAFSEFIRRFISAHHRWNSPKYVLGESYGTTRGAALTHRLHQDGINLTGLVLISNILDYAHSVATDDQFYLGYFPTFATVARYHEKAGAGLDIAEQAQQARIFADTELRPALARGDALGAETTTRIAHRFAELTGLSTDYVEHSDLRVLDTRFRKELLRADRQIVGRYDGRVHGYDRDAVSDEETFVVDHEFLSPAYATAVNAYLRDELEWSPEVLRREHSGFDWESSEPGKGWIWQHTLPAGTKNTWEPALPYPNVVPDLATSLLEHPTLKVLIGNGYFDLCTPFFQTEYDIDHLGIPAALHDNIVFTYYPAGHMLYSSAESLGKFTADLTAFYEARTPDDVLSLDERPSLPPLA